MNKKYTVVYPECFVCGSHRTYLPKYKHIETNNLEKILVDEFGADVYFVFDGWIEETKD